MDTVLIYRDQLLQRSETFIISQAESLSSLRPVYVGCNRVINGIRTPDDRTVILGSTAPSRRYRARLTLIGPSRRDLRSLKDFNPTLIHAHFGLSATRAMSIAKALDIPLVVTLHGWDAIAPDDLIAGIAMGLRVYIWRRKRLARMVSTVLCVSEFMRPHVLAKGFSAERIIVHYTGVDTEYFTPDPSVPREPVVLFVGRLAPEKGCQFLIEAMQRVQTIRPDVELVVIGEGEARGDLEREARRRLLKYQFLGYQPPAIIRSWLNRATVFSTPSVSTPMWQETFGMVFGEAQSMSLPVATFASGGIPEVVLHDETGLLAPERDEAALAANILRLLTDGALWNRLSESGHRHMRDRFNLRRQAVVLESIYHDTVQQWRGHDRSRSNKASEVGS